MGTFRMTQITALVLRAVAQGHRHGFDVMEACDLPSGTAYPALRRLERAGLLRARWENAAAAHAEGRPRRRTYELTAQGRTALPDAEEKLAQVRRLLEVPAPVQVRRA
ncbi:MAG TPA: PadR family transcriptional regulator [Longimicrobiales bacterium]|nr:PadR family transcriptional regulator [Longimicrobiales bacterium]